jgi:hypothetical protein
MSRNRRAGTARRTAIKARNGAAGLKVLQSDTAVARWCRHRLSETEEARCLIPRFDGAILSLEWKEAVWDRFVMGAPRPRTPSEQQYSDRKLRSRR